MSSKFLLLPEIKLARATQARKFKMAAVNRRRAVLYEERIMRPKALQGEIATKK